MPRFPALLVCLCGLALSASGPFAQGTADCERLAQAAPAAEGTSAAIMACEAALAAEPGEMRIVYHYALALERAGRIDDARRIYQWAADDGYAAAIDAVARLASADVNGAVTGWTEPERAELRQSMAGIATAMRRYRNELPPDPSDPLTIIAEIGTDPAALTEWVASNTRLIPYVGSLRGARGVLSDRSGNSLDRALALAALLAVAGEDTRIARTTLDEKQAQALFDVTRKPSTPVPAPSVPTSEAMLELLLASGVPEHAARQAIEETLRQRERIAATFETQTAVLMPLLIRSTDSAGVAATPALQQMMVQQLQDHFWVQVQRGDDWIDLDPDVGTLGPLTEAEAFDAAQVPEQLRHAATIRVIVEIQTGSQRQEHTLVSWTGFAAEQSERLISLSHVTDAGAALAQLADGSASEQFLTAVERTSEWTPLLSVDGQVYFDKLFTRDGQVREVDPNALTQVGRSIASGFAQADQVLGGDAVVPAEEGIATAEWIEVELTAPGQPSRIERRTLFDLLGPARRASNSVAVPTADQLRDRALRLLGSSDMLVLAANPSRTQLLRGAADAIAEAADYLGAVAQQPELPQFADLPEARRFVLPLRRFAQERLGGDGKPAISAPNVFLLHQRFVWVAGAGARAQGGIDIVFNDIVDAEAPFAARVEQGVKDSVLETAIIEGGESTARDTVLDASTGREWRLLQAGDEHLLSPLAPDLRARILEDMAAGREVLASLGPSGRGWWRIDPMTGNVLAMSWEGGGEVMAGEALIIRHVVSAGVCLGAAGAAIVGGTRGLGRAAGVACMVAGAATGVPAAIGAGGLGGVALGGVWLISGFFLASTPNLPQ